MAWCLNHWNDRGVIGYYCYKQQYLDNLQQVLLTWVDHKLFMAYLLFGVGSEIQIPAVNTEHEPYLLWGFNYFCHRQAHYVICLTWKLNHLKGG